MKGDSGRERSEKQSRIAKLGDLMNDGVEGL